MRHMNHSLLPALLLGAVAMLSGCAGGGGTGGSPSASTSSQGQGQDTDLQISIRADGNAESAHFHLLCDGPVALERSNHPRAAAACALVDAHPQLLTEPAAGATRMCTQQYGGPAIARVTGTRDGQAVERTFDLHDGCAISDWTAALALLVDQPSGQLQ